MLFSDKLIEIGKNSNKKNNLSMSDANKQMVSECRSMIVNGSNPDYVANAYKLATSTLIKDGYPLFAKSNSLSL